eukprot:CFRG6754T1
MNTLEYCQKLPKIELHAHLNGSADDDCLHKLMDLYKKRRGFLPSEASDKSVYAIRQGETRTLSQCFGVFKAIHALTDTPQALSLLSFDVVKKFAADEVRYLELRTTPKPTPTNEEYVHTVVKALKAAEDSCDGKIIVRLLLSIDRRGTLEKALETVHIAVQNKPFVVGIDFSGDPSFGHARDFQSAWDLAKENGLKLAIHFAEIENTDESLYILNCLKADRLGHGTFMGNGVEEALLKSNIPLEVCISSNVMARTVKTHDDHHFHDLYEKGYPCAISTDDMGVFSTSLSNEYKMASSKLQMSHGDLGTLSYKTIDYIFAEEEVKRQLRELWRTLIPNLAT